VVVDRVQQRRGARDHREDVRVARVYDLARHGRIGCVGDLDVDRRLGGAQLVESGPIARDCEDGRTGRAQGLRHAAAQAAARADDHCVLAFQHACLLL
jgi:hypothetical protein